jgi:hypothetical protein
LRFNRFVVLSFALSAAALLAQDAVDRDAYARDHVRFLVQQLDEWTKDFPRSFNAALLKPPVDSGKLSETAKGGADEFTRSVKRLASLSGANDLLTNAGFRDELQRTLSTMKEVNQAFASQRFPTLLHADWDQIRSTLNNLARVYRFETLAVLEAPGGDRGGKGARGATTAAAVPGGIAPGGGLSGYIVDLSCAKRGKGMWVNAECVARCIRDGDKAVLVTEEGKIFHITNPDKITPESYGQVVILTGKTQGDTITVDAVKL